MLLTRLHLALAGVVIALLLAALVYESVSLRGFLWIDGAKDKVADLQRDNNELRAAAREAERLNLEQVERIERQQQEIFDERARDLNSRLERLRRELREQGSAAGSPPGRTGAGGPDQGSPGADGPSGVCLTPEEQLRAAENEERHDQLITLIEQQLSIPRN